MTESDGLIRTESAALSAGFFLENHFFSETREKKKKDAFFAFFPLSNTSKTSEGLSPTVLG